MHTISAIAQIINDIISIPISPSTMRNKESTYTLIVIMINLIHKSCSVHDAAFSTSTESYLT